MGWLGESPYNCPACNGDGDVECQCCGCETECDECDGTGWDPEKIDIEAFKKAETALNKRVFGSGAMAGTYEWIENGVRLGRTSKNCGSVRASDFLLSLSDEK